MPENQKPGEFKTSLVGFKKADVLAYIDQLSQQALQAQKESEEKAAAMQNDLDLLQQDKEKLVEKTREVCDMLTNEKRRANDEETRARALREQLEHIEETAQSYKSRLFTKEQETVVLRADVDRLTKMLEEQKAEMEAVRKEVLSAQQAANEREAERDALKAECEQHKQSEEIQRQSFAQQLEAQNAQHAQKLEQQAAKAQDEYTQRLAQQEAEYTAALDQEKQAVQQELLLGKARLEQQEKANRQKVQSGAQQIADTMLLLRHQLDQVDRQIADAASQLQKATSAVYDALGQTEAGLEQMGAQVKDFPDSAARKSEKQKVQSEKAAERREKSRVHQTKRPSNRKNTVSENLLELLERLMK